MIFLISPISLINTMQETKESVPFIMLDETNTSLPLYRQIYQQIRREILKGEISSKTRLPSTRALASQLGVSRITVTNAYEQLLAEGYLEGKTGVGTFVASELPEKFLQTTRPEKKGIEHSHRRKNIRLSKYGENLNKSPDETSVSYRASKLAPFQNGLPAINEFPIKSWIKIKQNLQKNFFKTSLGYGDARGFEPLREAISVYLKSSRGVVCTPKQIIITNGSQQSLDLIGRVLVNKNDQVWLENPCYLGAKDTFSSLEAKSIYLPVDDEGLNFSKTKDQKPKLIYITPSHQFPLGITMSLQRRLNLLEWAEKKNIWIIEDDYNSEYRFSGRPLSSLQGLDRSGQVIYLGTFSKTIFPALRLGCMVVPYDLIEVFTKAKALIDRHSPIFEQMVLAEFIAENHFSRHIRRMRKLYAERRQIMINALEKHLGNKIRIQPSSAGLHLTIWLDKPLDDVEISHKLNQKGIINEPLSKYVFGEKLPPALILGYAAFDEYQIKNGIRELAQIIQSFTGK